MNYITIELLVSLLLLGISEFIFYKKGIYIKKEENENNLDFIKKNKIPIITSVLLAIFFILRLINIEKIPYGINLDESSAGYEAWNLLKFGKDSHGLSYPVHFIAWGSGQNALYIYLLIPFIKLFGLNILAVRLPMAVISCISLVVLYLILNNRFSKKASLFGLFIFGTIPFLFMKSRWGLESWLTPDVILFIYYNFDKYLTHKKDINLYLAFVFIALCCYTYSITFIIMPLFVIFIFLSLVVFRKRIPLKKFMVGLLLTVVLVSPLIAFSIINVFKLKTFTIGIFTIPRLTTTRFNEFASSLKDVSNNLASIYDIFFKYSVSDFYNRMEFFGVFFPLITLYFAYYGFKYVLQKSNENIKDVFYLLLSFFIPSLIFSILTITICINRFAVGLSAISIFIAIGGAYFIDKSSILEIKIQRVLIGLTTFCLVVFSIGFTVSYFKEFKYPNKQYTSFSNAIVDISSKARKNNKKIILLAQNSSLYSYYLFGSQTPYTKLKTATVDKKKIDLSSEGYVNIDDKFINTSTLELNKNTYYIFDYNYTVQQTDSFKKLLDKADIKYKEKVIDYYYIIETE